MLIIFAVILAGVVAGRIFAPRKLSFMPRVITPIIWMLLFLLGAEVGSSPEVVRGLATLGGKALVIFAASVAGSIAASWLLWRYVQAKTRNDEG